MKLKFCNLIKPAFGLQTIFLGTMAMGLWFFPATIQAHPFTVDQENVTFAGESRAIIGFPPIGQEFKPAFNLLDVVELLTADRIGGNGNGVNLQVDIRRGSITGTIEGTSQTLTLPDGFGGASHFDFLSPVHVTPGDIYVIEVVQVSGDVWDIFSTDNTYANGVRIISGFPEPSRDLWFREGAAVPEPSTLLILASGLAGLIGFGRAHRKH